MTSFTVSKLQTNTRFGEEADWSFLGKILLNSLQSNLQDVY